MSQDGRMNSYLVLLASGLETRKRNVIVFKACFTQAFVEQELGESLYHHAHNKKSQPPNLI